MNKMTAPDSKDTLLLYISASHSDVSAALVLEREIEGCLKQVPVYFISEALSGSKLFYSELEKIPYAVIMSSRKLRYYFEAHKIVVVTNQLLHDLFNNREASSRISKWASELLEFYVDFERRSAIKSQVLADFIANWTSPTYKEEAPIEPWVIYCDGAWCKDGVGVSAIIESPSGVKMRYAARLNFIKPDPSTNNTTEYEALLLGLQDEGSRPPKLHSKIRLEGHYGSHRERIQGPGPGNNKLPRGSKGHGETLQWFHS
jgi:hypothetical protein